MLLVVCAALMSTSSVEAFGLDLMPKMSVVICSATSPPLDHPKFRSPIVHPPSTTGINAMTHERMPRTPVKLQGRSSDNSTPKANGQRAGRHGQTPPPGCFAARLV